ncbi:hypothetical protein B9K05_02355 [Acetobacter syzygii]|uniref:Uncharacterized protein n=1 Tax=Acetobacter syzygii TaxID=146476 RepID=A0A270BT02_9PROT|nr:hypothetical protein B9K05_02355 [Acetobacter syzygii]
MLIRAFPVCYLPHLQQMRQPALPERRMICIGADHNRLLPRKTDDLLQRTPLVHANSVVSMALSPYTANEESGLTPRRF